MKTLSSLIAAGVIAVGTMTTLAAAANAETAEQHVQALCAELGGTYYTSLSTDGTERDSTCCYKQLAGKGYGQIWCDQYMNGIYQETTPGKAGPVSGPGAPPAKNPPFAPPITKAPPAATAN